MADRLFHPPAKTSEAEAVTLFLTIVGASDVEASGFTVTNGSEHVASVARSAEGKFTITLTDTYYKFLGFDYDTTRSDSKLIFEAEDVDGAKTIQLIAEEAGANTDPDSATMHIRLHLQNSSVT